MTNMPQTVVARIRRAVSIAINLAGILGVGLLAGCANPGRIGDGYSLSPQNVASTIDAHAARKHPLVVLDVRALDQYRSGHLAGAIWLDLTTWTKLAKSSDRGFADRAGWEKRIGDLGIDTDDSVLIYDGGEMTEAARVWYLLQYFGAENVAVLDGGYPTLAAIIAKDRIVTGDPPSPIAKSFTPGKGGWFPASEPKPAVALANKKSVLQTLNAKSARIVDARTTAEFSGRDRKNNPRGGHLRDAVNIPHADLLDAGGRLKSAEDLRKIFENAGLKQDEAMVIHCQSGGRASLAALAAMKAGYKNISNYYMSFGEWAMDETCPLEMETSTEK